MILRCNAPNHKRTCFCRRNQMIFELLRLYFKSKILTLSELAFQKKKKINEMFNQLIKKSSNSLEIINNTIYFLAPISNQKNVTEK